MWLVVQLLDVQLREAANDLEEVAHHHVEALNRRSRNPLTIPSISLHYPSGNLSLSLDYLSAIP